MKFIKSRYVVGVLLFFLSLPTIVPLFYPGFFPMHDDTQIARVFTMAKSLSDGMFPVRWVADLGYGYGYPIFNFYAPLAYYVGAFFIFVGFDALIATKIMIGLSMLLAGFSMYLLAKEFWGKSGGIVSAIFYAYAPYHALNLYVRGDIAELWAYALVPLVFYSLWRLSQELSWKYMTLTACAYAGVIISHNLSAMMISPFIFLAGILLSYRLYKKGVKTFYYIKVALIVGILLSAFYWLPTFAEMSYTHVLSQIGGKADFRDHFVCPIQLWSSAWMYGGSTPNCIDGLSFMIGKLHIIFSITALLAVWLLPKEKEKKRIIVFSFLGFVFSLFLTLEVSRSLWEVLPLMAFFQYPWRFLLAATFFGSFLAGACIYILQRHQLGKKNYARFLSAALLIVLSFMLYAKFFIPQEILSRTAREYTSMYALRWTASKISDEYMPKDFDKPESNRDYVQNRFTLLSGSARLGAFAEKTDVIRLELQATTPIRLRLNIAYFPAWQIEVDGKKMPYTITHNGLEISLPRGKHMVTARFVQTPIEQTANLISMGSILLLIAGIIVQSKRQKSR